jgi:hypothetical protein
VVARSFLSKRLRFCNLDAVSLFSVKHSAILRRLKLTEVDAVICCQSNSKQDSLGRDCSLHGSIHPIQGLPSRSTSKYTSSVHMVSRSVVSALFVFSLAALLPGAGNGHQPALAIRRLAHRSGCNRRGGELGGLQARRQVRAFML